MSTFTAGCRDECLLCAHHIEISKVNVIDIIAECVRFVVISWVFQIADVSTSGRMSI